MEEDSLVKGLVMEVTARPPAYHDAQCHVATVGMAASC